MKGNGYSKKAGLVGCGVGAVLFVAFGMLQGSLIGGTAGVEAGGYLFSDGAVADLATRVLAAAGMLAGVAFAALVFLASGFTAGRLVGLGVDVIGAARKGEALPRAARN